jgi:glutaredoxin
MCIKRPNIHSLLLAVLLGVSLAGASPALASQQDGLQGDPQRSYGAIDVILYQTSWCPYCNKARAFLQEMGVTLVEHDIEREPEKRQEMMAKSGSPGVPVVDIEGIVIRGYSPEAMRMAIERKRRE